MSENSQKSNQIKINEIFFSIQGESTRFGLPTVFVRTSGCHLRCTYCDTTYAYHKGEWQTVDNIVDKIREYPTRYICVTGGEPLLQKAVLPLMVQLSDEGYQVSLETSGDISCEGVDPRVKKIIDVKTPDSGAFEAFSEKNLQLDDVNSEFKFVICSEKDFNWSVQFCVDNNLFEKFPVLFSPSFSQVDEKWLAKKILSVSHPIRLQLQMHKYIWSPEEVGV